MAHPTLQDARELTEWQPPLGVLSVYLGFAPDDRAGAWRTELRNGLDAVLAGSDDVEHGRRVALRATVARLAERFEGGHRPPPRGEAGFVEVSERGGEERWWPIGVAPQAPAPVLFGERPVVASLIEVCRECEEHGVALVSAERIRLLRCCCGVLEELEGLELTLTSLDWRERKASSSSDPARAQGVSSSGHDQYEERLEHNRRRFLEQAGRLAGKRLGDRGMADALVFAPAADVEQFADGLRSTAVEFRLGDEKDLISAPRGELQQPVAAALERLTAERDRAVAEHAVEEAQGGSRGAAGLQETIEALGEARVEHLVFDQAIGEPAELLVRGALAGSAEITPLSNGVADALAPAEGVAALLRY